MWAVVVQSGDVRAGQIDPKYNDYPVQCGAAYFLIWQGYKSKNEIALSEEYRRKYEKLIENAEEKLKARGLSKSGSDKYIQDHVDKLFLMMRDDTKLFADFKSRCDAEFAKT
jgi:hypothetical protein